MACAHPVIFGGMCAVCSANVFDLTRNQPELLSTVILPSNPDIQISQNHAVQQQKTLVQRLLKEKKLYLILDLDQTILHATDAVVAFDDYEQADQIEQFELENGNFAVKFRPGLEGWLEEISKLYEIHIFTNATRGYAEKIALLIEERTKKKYFGSGKERRIMSRTETCSDMKGHQKNLNTIFPGVDKISVILDDKESVWASSVHNVVQIFPYDFFVGHGDPNDPSGIQRQANRKKKLEQSTEQAPEPPSKKTKLNPKDSEGIPETPTAEFNPCTPSPPEPLANPPDDSSLPEPVPIPQQANTEPSSEPPVSPKVKFVDQDDHLLAIFDVMRDIHHHFFKEYEATKRIPSLKRHIQARKKAALSGCRLLFSGVIPSSLPDPSVHPHWIKATKFGAKCVTSFDQTVTHLIAARPGTDKVNRLLHEKPGAYLVSPQWLINSLNYWSRQNETKYPVPGLEHKPVLYGPAPNFKATKLISSSSQIPPEGVSKESDSPDENLGNGNSDDGGSTRDSDNESEVLSDEQAQISSLSLSDLSLSEHSDASEVSV